MNVLPCPHCGKENKPSAKYCINCGAPLPVAVPAPQPAEPGRTQPVQPPFDPNVTQPGPVPVQPFDPNAVRPMQQPLAPPPGGPQQPYYGPAQPAPQKSGGKLWLCLGIGLGAVLLAAIGIVAALKWDSWFRAAPRAEVSASQSGASQPAATAPAMPVPEQPQPSEPTVSGGASTQPEQIG